MGKWEKARVGDLFELVTGYAFKSQEFKATGVPVIKIKNVKAGGFSKQEFSYVDKKYLSERANKVAQKDDLLISMSGNRHDGSPETWVGKVCHFGEDRHYLINQRVGALRLKKNRPADVRFFAFLLSGMPYQQTFIAIATSSGGQANLSPAQILGAPIRYPNLMNQRRIGEILGILNDKVELNRRMNETLEAMARAIFKDWFVDFGPTRAKAEGRAPYLAPELWDLFPDALDDEGKPAGWISRTLDTLFDVKIGRTPPRKESHHFVPHGAGMTWLSIRTMGKVQTFATDSEEDLTLESVEHFRVPVIDAGTVMVSFKLTVGRVAIAAEDMCSNEAIAQLRPRIDTPISFLFTYCFMKAFDYDSLGSTSSIATAVNSKSIRQIGMIVPDRATQAAFEALTQPIFDRILRNIRESDSLMATRDLLLPKLMSGEIHLRIADRATTTDTVSAPKHSVAK